MVIQEIFGVNKVMRDIADGLASRGFYRPGAGPVLAARAGHVELTDQTDAEWKEAFG